MLCRKCNSHVQHVSGFSIGSELTGGDFPKIVPPLRGGTAGGGHTVHGGGPRGGTHNTWGGTTGGDTHYMRLCAVEQAIKFLCGTNLS